MADFFPKVLGYSPTRPARRKGARMGYFSNINAELLEKIPVTAESVLEIGCAGGRFGAAFLARHPGAVYVGVELSAPVAAEAARRLPTVLVGDIEEEATVKAAAAAAPPGGYAVLVLGDVLEHLRDPWRTLASLRGLLRPDGLCAACIPNVAHWSVALALLQGRWNYEESGLLDRTHLRFFTLESIAGLFKKAGFAALEVAPRILWPEKTAPALQGLKAAAVGLGLDPETVQRNAAAYQWLVRGCNAAPPPPLSVAALGLREQGGVTRARVDAPLSALSTRPGVRVAYGHASLELPADMRPGVYIFHRYFLHEAGMQRRLEELIAAGWVVISEIDDDPHHWPQYVDSDFYAFRAVHAVTCSTPLLADMLRPCNPNIFVLPNAASRLEPCTQATPKDGARCRIFFGAFNRQEDWAAMAPTLYPALCALGEAVELVMVNDQDLYADLPAGIPKTFHPRLRHHDYMRVLASCDLALLPLNETAFNKFKSDLKFVECCAAGVVPVCSPLVYASRPEHREIGVFVPPEGDWGKAVRNLCRNPDDLAARKKRGLDYVARQRMFHHQTAAREALYRRLLQARPQLEAQRRARLAAWRAAQKEHEEGGNAGVDKGNI